MSEKQRPNPLREGLSSKAVQQPCAIVIFGATGDLTHRKLVPALYNIAADGEMPPAVAVIGFARRPKTDEEFRREMEESTRKFSRQTVRDEIWDGFAKSLFYHQSEFGDEAGYEKLAQRLDRLDKESGTRGNRLFYFAASPDQFETIVQNLKKAGLNKAREGSWARVILEKPFGTDLKSARHLNRVVQSSFSEDQTYRIDHFLGKETAQNILVLRFANAIFEPLWNSRYIDHVQITAAETLGVEIAPAITKAPAPCATWCRIIFCSCFAWSEWNRRPISRPTVFGTKRSKWCGRSVASAKRKSAFTLSAVSTEGAIAGKPVAAYREEKGVDPQSQTETYVALRVRVDNWRWADVPIYVRVGKRLPKSGTEISVHFKKAPQVLFNRESQSPDQNVLVIRIQPDEESRSGCRQRCPGRASGSSR